MIRQILKTQNKQVVIDLPEDYMDKEIEITVNLLEERDHERNDEIDLFFNQFSIDMSQFQFNRIGSK